MGLEMEMEEWRLYGGFSCGGVLVVRRMSMWRGIQRVKGLETMRYRHAVKIEF